VATASVAVRLNAITGEFEKAFSTATRTVSGFERTFVNAASSIQSQQQKINQAFADFSGDKIFRDAAALSTAIQQIGGASKLTEAEMRRVNVVVQEAINKYTQLGQTAPKHLLDLAAATKQLETSSVQAVNAVKNLEPPMTLAGRAAGVLGSAFGQFTLAGLAVTAINKLTGELTRFVAEGAKLPGLEASFNRLTTSIGADSSEMLRTLQVSTRGLVSELDLMQSANKAVLLGLPVTTQSMGELAKTATVLGKAMGQDATTSLNDLITALGRSSPLILDNLGLTVKVGEANEKYARQLGISVEQMTEAQKKMAFYNAAMDAAREKTAQLGTQTLTLGEQFSVVWTRIGDNVTRGAANINVALGNALSSFANFRRFLVDAATFTSWEDMRRNIEAANAAADGGPRGGRPRSMLQQAREEAAAFAELQASARALNAQALKPLTDTQRELVLEFNKGGLGAKDIADKLNGVKTTAGVSETQISKFLGTLKQGTKETSAFTKAVESLADNLSGDALAGEVKKLQAAFDNLQRTNRDTPEAMRRTADAALDLFREGAKLTPELFQLAAASGRLSELLPPVRLGMQGLEKEFLDVAPAIRSSAKEMIDFLETLNDPKLNGVLGLSGLTLPGEKVGAPKIPEPPVDSFREWIRAIDGISSALFRMAGDSRSSFAGMIRDVAFVVDAFGQAAKAAQAYRAATNTAGRVGALVEGAAAFWQATGAQGRGAATFGGAATGAQIGGSIVPGWGHVIGGVAGAIAGWVRSGGQGREEVERFADSQGGFAKLQQRLLEMGDAGEALWKKLTQGVGSNNPDQAVAVINEVVAALDEFGTEAERAQRKLDALGQAVEGVNTKAALFASPFQALLEAQNAPDADLDAIGRKFAAAAQAGQAEFERLGVFVGATFAGIVNETGNAIGALQSLAPAISILQQGIEKFGLTSTSTIDQLVSLFGLVNDATTGPILSSIQATTQIFTGLQDAGYMTAELFQTVSDDIGASFRDLEAKGGDVAKAMALSQPILQKLWEAQQRYGDVTDETTAALLRQAEEQGLVGAHMQDVNQKILQVLIAIADVFGAEIPDALREMSSAATDAAEEMQNAFGSAAGNTQSDLDRIRAPKITIPVDFDINNPDLAREDIRPFNFSSGGESEYAPSSVSGPDASSATFIMNVDGRTLAEATVPYIPGEVQRFGLA
jgi:hypothetical protein